jgi:ribosomal protein S18 acetylase RimI-like enzyme
MGKIKYRWMGLQEIDQIAEIDRAEHVRLGYSMVDGRLTHASVDWNIPSFFIQGNGAHTMEDQRRFCLEHLEQGGQMIGAFDGDRLVGVGIIRPEIREGMAQLAYLHVSHDYRRRGIASLLARKLFIRAEEEGTQKVYVSATPSESAVGFYLSHGFEPVEEPLAELYELEPEDIHMLKQL